MSRPTAVASPAGVIIDTADPLLVTNDGETLLERPHFNRIFRIEPGDTAIVPFDFVRVWWGDPRSVRGRYVKFHDSLEKGTINKREEEIRRLSVLYGSYGGDDVDHLLSPDWPAMSPHVGTPKVVPHPVTVRTQSGTVIIPACFDRSGTAVYGTMVVDSADLNDQATLQAHLLAELDSVKARLAELDARSISDLEPDSGTGR